MQRREFITAAVGMAAAVASASQAFAQEYPDFGAIKKMPVGEGAAEAAKKGIEGEAGAAKKGVNPHSPDDAIICSVDAAIQLT